MSLVAMFLTAACAADAPASLELVQIGKDGKRFVLEPSGRPFRAWGMNYPAGGRFLEDDWYPPDKLLGDFLEMRNLGANVVRIHLEFGLYMDAPDRPSTRGMAQLDRVLAAAEQAGLYLDVTGLACYRPKDTPAWYERLAEAERWAAQASFWEAVAKRCAGSRAVFCYDLINEPIVPAQRREPGQWMSGNLFGGCDFVQYIALDPAGRTRDDIARQWIRRMCAAIRKHDRRHLVTLGLLPSSPRGGHMSGFIPASIAPELDFLCVHVYPEAGKVREALKITNNFYVGKPLVIEETYPLSCGVGDLREYLLASRSVAVGWIGHYGGERLADLDRLHREGKAALRDEMVRQWLLLFRELGPEMLQLNASGPAGPSGQHPVTPNRLAGS